MKAIIDKDGDSDGLADIVELNSAYDYALVLTKCGWRADPGLLSAAAPLACSVRMARSWTDGGEVVPGFRPAWIPTFAFPARLFGRSLSGNPGAVHNNPPKSYELSQDAANQTPNNR